MKEIICCRDLLCTEMMQFGMEVMQWISFEVRPTKLLLRNTWEVLGIEWKGNTQARERDSLMTFWHSPQFIHLLQPSLHIQRIIQILFSKLYSPMSPLYQPHLQQAFSEIPKAKPARNTSRPVNQAGKLRSSLSCLFSKSFSQSHS